MNRTLLYRTAVVKREMRLKARLSTYQSVYVPTIGNMVTSFGWWSKEWDCKYSISGWNELPLYGCRASTQPCNITESGCDVFQLQLGCRSWSLIFSACESTGCAPAHLTSIPEVALRPALLKICVKSIFDGSHFRSAFEKIQLNSQVAVSLF